jgi:heptosyltransferase-3
VSSKAAPLEVILREGGLIHAAIAYPVGTRSVRELRVLAKTLRELNADVLVYLTAPRGLLNAFRDCLFFKLCGFKEIIGAPLTTDLQKCRRIGTELPDGSPVEEGESERLARCLRALGTIDLDDPKMWDLCLTDQELRVGTAASAPLASTPYFAINMGGKAEDKDWGLQNWRSLIGELVERHPDFGLLIVGAAEDSERAQLISQGWAGPVVDACGTLSPRESAAAMRDALVFIGHVSGPLHMAAATGVPCVGLFGSYNQPKRWHPRGQQHRIIHRMSGLHTIAVSEVVDAVQHIVPLRQECA